MPEQILDPAGKRGRDSRAGLIAATESGQDFARELCRCEGGSQAVQHLADAFIQRQIRDRPGARAGDVVHRHVRHRELGIEDAGGPHLVPIVILRVHPEHRNRIDAVVRLDLPGELDGGDGLQQGVERSTEHTGLLSGDDGDRGGGEQLPGRRVRLRRRTTPSQLPGDHVVQVAATPVSARHARDRLLPVGPACAGLPANRGANLPKSWAYSLTSGRIQGKRRRSMASRTAVDGAAGCEGFDTTPIYYRRASISCSQGAPALPFDDASGVSAPSAFGTFRVLHQIGSGVLGPVFRSYDSQRDRLVAIKAFKLDLVPEAAARFADACRDLIASPPAHPAAHPAIVAAVDAGVEGSTPYLALEYASGDALDVFLRQSGALSAARALTILQPLAQAIDASWEQGVGHGSLHPRDVFTTGTPSELRVTGFGIAQALERVGVKPPVRRPYAAPERIEGGEWDQHADVYALAVIAHEMLTGHRPRRPATRIRPAASDAAGASAHGEPWRAVLAKGMAERPEDRFDTAVALADAIAAIAGTDPPAELRAAPAACRDRSAGAAKAAVATPATPRGDCRDAVVARCGRRR